MGEKFGRSASEVRVITPRVSTRKGGGVLRDFLGLCSGVEMNRGQQCCTAVRRKLLRSGHCTLPKVNVTRYNQFSYLSLLLPQFSSLPLLLHKDVIAATLGVP